MRHKRIPRRQGVAHPADGTMSPPIGTPDATILVPSDQGVVAVPTSVLESLPRKPTKAVVAALVTVLGLVGIHVTTGTAQLLVMVAQVVIVFYGVWRARNHPRVNAADRLRGYFQ